MPKVIKEQKKVLRFKVFNGYKITLIRTSDVHATVRHHRLLKTLNLNMDESTLAITIHVHCDGKTQEEFIVFPWKAGQHILAHEAWHAVQSMLEWHDVPPMGEVAAYHLGYVVGEMQ